MLTGKVGNVYVEMVENLIRPNDVIIIRSKLTKAEIGLHVTRIDELILLLQSTKKLMELLEKQQVENNDDK